MTIRVWSPWLRILHWLLAVSTVLAFASHEGNSRLHAWHEVFGYGSLATAASRIALGFAARGALQNYWRFSGFVKSVSATLLYTKDVLNRREARHLGHNPLGAWMVVALLANAILCGLTGWLFTTDQFWGIAWVERLHGASGEAFVPLVIIHLLGVAYSSYRHKESLVAAMLHGDKKS
jgi:cytochrome b